MNYTLNLVERICGYMKQQPEHKHVWILKLLHTHFRYERTHNGKFNKKYMHIRKEVTDCYYDIHMNLCSKSPAFGSVILLKIGHTIHNTKSLGFQPSFHKM